MNRGIHVVFLLVALACIVGVGVLWPDPPQLRTGATPTSFPTPTPSIPSAAPPSTPVPSTPGAGLPTVPPLPTLPTGPDGSLTCPPAQPVSLAVLTFNIHGALGHGGLHMERIAQEIEAWRADVVLLQEVDRHRRRTRYVDQPAWFAERLGMHATYGVNVLRRPPGPGRPRQEYGTAILSRFPIVSWSNSMLPNRPGLEQRGLLRATIQVGSQQVDVYNTHLQHTRGNIRILQMAAVRDLIDDVQRPMILGGDFNAPPGSPTLRIALSLLRDPWPVVGEGPGGTVPPRVPRRRIDFVLHDESFLPTAAQVLKSSISDHRAVRVVLELPQPPAC